MKHYFWLISAVVLALSLFITTNINPVRAEAGSFHISQWDSEIWVEKFVEPFSVNYETKSFNFLPIDNEVKLNIVQKTVSFGDIEQVQLQACGQNMPIYSAKYIDSGVSVMDIVKNDDNYVSVNHDMPIEVVFHTPEGCDQATLLLNAHEYESLEKNAFFFPAPFEGPQKYAFKNNGSLTVDGLLKEVDGKSSPTYSINWHYMTGHPSNPSYIYIVDDNDYVYIGADITGDNTDEFGQDWFKILVHNAVGGQTKEFRVDDNSPEYGTCAQGMSSKVSYPHQQCEIKIPKSEIDGNELNFVMRYYGTGSGIFYSTISMDSVITDRTPTFKLRVYTYDGLKITGVKYGIETYPDHHAVIPMYENACTPDDGAFDSSDEEVTCEVPMELNYRTEYDLKLEATSDAEAPNNVFYETSPFALYHNYSALVSLNNSGVPSTGKRALGGITIFNNRLYGVLFEGGANSVGALISTALNGSDLRVHHNFASGGADVRYPASAVAVNGGVLYGFSQTGGGK